MTVPGSSSPLDALFRPITINTCTLRNRIVMCPMTRGFSPGGIPGQKSIDYYRRRAEGGVGLIITEGVAVNPEGSSGASIPNFFGDEALAQWKLIADAVHQAGGRIMPQLWHAGLVRGGEGLSFGIDETIPSLGPSGFYPNLVNVKEGQPPYNVGRTMTEADIDRTIDDCVRFAESAQRLGFDGIQLHGAHGYLFDQFFWSATNRRSDRYNGAIGERTCFAVETIRAIRHRVGPDFPLCLRFSQWKLPQNYGVRMLATPQELEQFLEPLVDAGIDFFDCSTRRFWEPEFPGSDLNLAGWTQRISGRPAVAVGSVGLSGPLMTGARSPDGAQPVGIDKLLAMLERGDFDLVGVGRALIPNPDWPNKVRAGRDDELRPYTTHTDDLY